MSRVELVYLTILVEGGLLILGAGIAWWAGVPVWSKINVSGFDILLGIGTGLILTMVAIWALQAPFAIFEQLRRDSKQVIDLLKNLNLPLIVLISIAAGVCEEFLFRGVLQPLFTDWLGLVYGLFITSLLFGLAHYISFSYFAYVSIFSILIGLLYVWTDNLVAPVVAHTVYDFALLYWAIYVRGISHTD